MSDNKLRRKILKCIWDWFEDDAMKQRKSITVDNVIARIPEMLFGVVYLYGGILTVLAFLRMPFLRGVNELFAVFSVVCLILFITITVLLLLVIIGIELKELYNKIRNKKIVSCKLFEPDEQL